MIFDVIVGVCNMFDGAQSWLTSTRLKISSTVPGLADTQISCTVVPKSMQHIERISDPIWKEKWIDAAYKETDGLYYETKMFDIVKELPEGDKHRTVLPTTSEPRVFL